MQRRDSVGERIEGQLQQHILSEISATEDYNEQHEFIYDSYPSSSASSSVSKSAAQQASHHFLQRRDSVGDRIEQQLDQHLHEENGDMNDVHFWSARIANAPIRMLAKVLAVINATKRLGYLTKSDSTWLKTSVLDDEDKSCNISICHAALTFLEDHDVERLLMLWNTTLQQLQQSTTSS